MPIDPTKLHQWQTSDDGDLITEADGLSVGVVRAPDGEPSVGVVVTILRDGPPITVVARVADVDGMIGALLQTADLLASPPE